MSLPGGLGAASGVLCQCPGQCAKRRFLFDFGACISVGCSPVSQFMYFLPSEYPDGPLGLTSSFPPFQFSDFTGSGYALAFNDHQQLLSVAKNNYYQPRCGL